MFNELNLLHSYTIETSNGLFYHNNLSKQFNSSDFLSFGKHLGHSVL